MNVDVELAYQRIEFEKGYEEGLAKLKRSQNNLGHPLYTRTEGTHGLKQQLGWACRALKIGMRKGPQAGGWDEETTEEEEDEESVPEPPR